MRPSGLALRRVGAILTMGLVVSACGGESHSAQNPTSSATSATPSAASVSSTTDPDSPSTTVAESTTTSSTTTTLSTSTTTTTLPPIDAEALLEANCTVCHGDQLQGGTGPALTAGGHAGDHGVEELIEVITNGRGRMPAWKGTLTDEEIAEVARFIEELQGHEGAEH